MLRKTIIAAIFVLVSLSLFTASACNSQATLGGNTGGTTIKQTTIKAQLTGDSVAIPLNDVEKYINSRFLVKTATDQQSFMSYKYENVLYVRADICPPCGSESFTLTNGTLVCDRCGTVFDAKTGAGVRGACVKFPKISVSYEIKDGDVVMKGGDLTTAFQNTLHPKKS